MYTHNDERSRDAQAGTVEYAKQVLVLERLYIAAHLFGEDYHNWMVVWMINHPEISIAMLTDYYPKAMFDAGLIKNKRLNTGYEYNFL